MSELLPDRRSLSILSLTESSFPSLTNTRKPSGQVLSNETSQQTTTAASTPTSLSVDLVHYRELFSKLRFSYVEQVTKERFLRAITSDPPEFASAAENAELEVQLGRDKTALQEKKQEVREIIEALEEQGRQLARRYEQLHLQATELDDLPQEIERLQETIEQLKLQQEPKAEDAEMGLPLQQTRALLRERQQELTNVDLEIERLRAALPARKAEVLRLQDEIAPIQTRKIKAVEEAQEAKRRRAGGGMADELEEKSRWLRGVEFSLRAMLDV